MSVFEFHAARAFFADNSADAGHRDIQTAGLRQLWGEES